MIDKLRTALRIIPIFAVASVVVVSMFCMTFEGDILDIEPKTASVSTNDGYTTISMGVGVTSTTPSPLNNVILDVVLTDSSGKSKVSIWNGGPFTFEPGIEETIHIDSKIRTIPLMLLLYDNLGSPGSPMRFEIDAHFDYAFGLIGTEISAGITVSPSPDDTSLSVTAEDNVDTVTVDVSGLRQAYIPDETGFDVVDGSGTMSVGISPTSEGFRIVLSSDQDVTELLSSMDDATIVLSDGDTLPLDPSTAETVLDLLSSLGVRI